MVVKGIQKILIECTRRLLDLQSLPDKEPKDNTRAADTARAADDPGGRTGDGVEVANESGCKGFTSWVVLMEILTKGCPILVTWLGGPRGAWGRVAWRGLEVFLI